MSTDAVAADIPPLPPQDEALATLMASPNFQAQMAALTQQAAAQLRALVESMRALEGQLAPSPSGFGDGDDTLAGIWLPPPEPVLLPPVPKPGVQEGTGLVMPSDLFALARSAVMPATPVVEPQGLAPGDFAADMLAVLPPVAAPEPALPAAMGAVEPDSVDWSGLVWHYAGAEGGMF